MLTLKQLRDDKEAAVRRLAKKGVDARPVIDRIEQLDDRRKAIQQELDNCLSQQNQAAKMIGALMGQGKRDEAEAKKAEVAALKEKSVKLSAEMKQTADALQAEIVLLPNFPAEIVPEGTVGRGRSGGETRGRTTRRCRPRRCRTGSWPRNTTSSISTWA